MTRISDRIPGSHLFNALIACVAIGATANCSLAQPATGPLTVHPTNPRYFRDGQGNAVYLTGSHTWSNLQEVQNAQFSPTFDFNAYLDLLQQNNHNFMRLWRCELPKVKVASNEPFRTTMPHPWARTGPGIAGDGLPKFNLQVFDQTHFDRMRARCIAARDRGIYVSIMLFDGYEMHQVFDGWAYHPFNIANNINGINGDPNDDGQGPETNTLDVPAVTALQQAYIRKVIDTVNDLDNILYEIANEAHGGSVAWQNSMIAYIRTYESTKPKRHPVLFTTPLGNVSNELWESTAEAISPGSFVLNGAYRDDPPANNGSKIIINDTDHLWGCGGTGEWVWKCLTRGLNPIYMDSYYPQTPFCFPPDTNMRLNMGYARSYAKRMNLALAVPSNALSSTAYCLAEPGSAYLAFAPSGGNLTLSLSSAPGSLQVEWFNPSTGAATIQSDVQGGGSHVFTPPFSGRAVLFVHRANGDVNCNGTVGIDDLLAVINQWGVSPPPDPTSCKGGDINNDGIVDVEDVKRVISHMH